MTNIAFYGELREFEKEIGKTLPEDYKVFLVSWDGNVTDERFFRVNGGEEDEIYEVSEFFGFSDASSSLITNWDVSEFYDLQVYRATLSSYIAIGADDTGGIIMLDVESDQIKLLAHDYGGKNFEKMVGDECAILGIAHNFSQFRKNLLTEREAADDAFDQEWHETAELRRIKNERILEEHRLRKLKRERSQG